MLRFSGTNRNERWRGRVEGFPSLWASTAFCTPPTTRPVEGRGRVDAGLIADCQLGNQLVIDHGIRESHEPLDK